MKWLINLLPVILLIAGAAAIALGAWLIYRPAGYIVAGALLITAALLIIRGGADDDYKT